MKLCAVILNIIAILMNSTTVYFFREHPSHPWFIMGWFCILMNTFCILWLLNL